MKHLNVVAAIIHDSEGRIFATQRGDMENGRTIGSFPEVRLKMVRLLSNLAWKRYVDIFNMTRRCRTRFSGDFEKRRTEKRKVQRWVCRTRLIRSKDTMLKCQTRSSKMVGNRNWDWDRKPFRHDRIWISWLPSIHEMLLVQGEFGRADIEGAWSSTMAEERRT